MRKVQQRKILELLNTLQKAHDVLRKTSESDIIASILADCQEFAFSIGQYIENIEGEGTNTVVLLEEYCDIAYKASFENGNKGYIKLINNHLFKIENSVRNELIPNKFEIVFFPYLLSMFDALESVYLAAKADQNCDVYVVPIPWFDKLPNGKLGKVHYDGEQYPENIGITYWKDYDVEAHHPDVIYIHNPYDNDNYVTSVHPDYYSKRICNFTDCLVYIPYFVSTGTVTEEFCVVPGCIYAHKIILESEKVRDIYIQSFKKTLGNNLGQLKNKFVALGSPKFDAVINAKPENFTLSKEWCNKIYDEDGIKKKIVLYNTSVTAILRGNEQYLKKLCHVLSTFRGRDDVVLWWRPHPLNKIMYQSMRPQFLSDYEDIIANYKRTANGIYDDTSDLHRAMAYADCMLSDPSSLVALFQAKEKPILIQNINVITVEDDEIEAKFCSILESKDQLWFTDDRFNGLFEISKTDKSIRFLGEFHAEKGKDILFRLAALDERTNKLYFAPYNAKNIAIYNIVENTFSYVPLKKNNCLSSFFMPIIYNDYVYFTPYKNKAIIKLNKTTNELHYFDDWLEAFDQDDEENKDAYFLYPAVHKNKIFLASCRLNIVVEFDMDTDTSIIYKVGGNDYGYSGCCFDGENYWLTPRFDTPLIKWNPEVGIINEFDVKKFVSCSDGNILFQPAIFVDGFIWLFPRQADCVLKIDASFCTMEIIALENFFQNKSVAGNCNNLKSLFAQRFEDKIYIFDNYSNQLIVFDSRHNKVEKWDLKYSQDISKNNLPTYLSCFQANRKCFWEDTKRVSLPRFIDYIVANAQKMSNKQQNVNCRHQLKEGVGENIHNYIKKCIIDNFF